jgi:antitoxin component YwqK of YwqJK toxin-antitoxin module
MKIFVFLIIFLFYNSHPCNSKEEFIDEKFQKLLFKALKKKIYNGEFGNKKNIIITLTNGQLNGPAYTKFKNGLYKEQAYFKNGFLNGEF